MSMKRSKSGIRKQIKIPKEYNKIITSPHQLKSDVDVLLESVDYPNPKNNEKHQIETEIEFLSGWNQNTSQNHLRFQLLDEKSYEEQFLGKNKKIENNEVLNEKSKSKSKVRIQSAKTRKLDTKKPKSPYLITNELNKKTRPKTAQPKKMNSNNPGQKKNSIIISKKNSSIISEQQRQKSSSCQKLQSIGKNQDFKKNSSQLDNSFIYQTRPYSSHGTYKAQNQREKGSPKFSRTKIPLKKKLNYYLQNNKIRPSSSYIQKKNYQPFYDEKRSETMESRDREKEIEKTSRITSQEKRIILQNQRQMEKLNEIFNKNTKTDEIKKFLYQVNSQQNFGERILKNQPRIFDMKTPQNQCITLLNNKSLKFESLENYAKKFLLTSKNENNDNFGKKITKIRKKKKVNFFSENKNFQKNPINVKLKNRSHRSLKTYRSKPNKKFNFRSPEFIQSKINKRNTIGHHFKEQNKKKVLLSDLKMKNPFIKNSTLEYERMLKNKSKVIWKRVKGDNVDIGCFGVENFKGFRKGEGAEECSFLLESSFGD